MHIDSPVRELHRVALAFALVSGAAGAEAQPAPPPPSPPAVQPPSAPAPQTPSSAPAAQPPSAPAAQTPSAPAVQSPSAPPAHPLPAEPSAPAAPAPAVLVDEEELKSLDQEARQRFELGRTFYEAGRFPQAAEEFAEAYRLSGRPQLLYNLYVAHRDAANWPGAIEALRSYLAMVPDAPDRINLRARLQSMEEQAARMQAEEPRAQPTPPPPPPPPAVAPSRSVVPWVLVGSGSALVIGGIVAGVVAKNKNSDVDAACADGGRVCGEWTRSDAERAYALAIASDVLWTTGAAAAVTGLVLWFTGVLDEERAAPTVSLGASPRSVSASLTLRY